MAKISRPILWVAVLGAVGYAVVLLTEPEATKAKPKKPTLPSPVVAPSGFTAADMQAHFDRYVGANRNAFLPKVQAKKPAPTPAPLPMVDGLNGTWTLTGVNSLNGEITALLENNATKDTVFLKVGEVWNGLRVVSIEPKAVTLVSGDGKPVKFVFTETIEEPQPVSGVAPVTLPAPGAPVAAGGAATVPGAAASPAATPGGFIRPTRP